MIVALIISCISIFILLGTFVFTSKRAVDTENDFKGKVSVLIAARNEELNILNCLNSLIRQELPAGVDYEILVGDDQSSDKTSTIVQNFITEHELSFVHLYPIRDQLGKAKAKSNVLAHLTHKADGDVFLFTDADIVHQDSWVKSMLSNLKKDVGVVTGVTAINETGLFTLMQSIDWVFALSLVDFLSFFKLPVTSMGNNMLVTREAYFETGGYENMEFSITEDFQLFEQIVKHQKKEFVNVFSSDVLAKTQGKSSWVELLHQRKRWMNGVLQLPWYMIGMLFLQTAYYPSIIILLFIHFQAGVSVLFSKWALQTLFLHERAEYLRLEISRTKIILYELFVPLFALSTLFFSLFPFKLRWKGRTY